MIWLEMIILMDDLVWRGNPYPDTAVLKPDRLDFINS
jgi:hypothetical protein